MKDYHIGMIGRIISEKKSHYSNAENLVIFVFENKIKTSKDLLLLDKKYQANLHKKIELHQFSGKEGEMLDYEDTHLNGCIILVGAGTTEDFNLIKFQHLFATVVKRARVLKIKNLSTFYFDELGANNEKSIGKMLTMALGLSNYAFLKYKEHKFKEKQSFIETVKYYHNNDSFVDFEKGVSAGYAIVDGITLARDLVNEPGSHTHPETLLEQAKKIVENSQNKISLTVLHEPDCEKMGLGAFLGVARGSDRKPQFIILKYNSQIKTRESKKHTICLIGKSVTFDSGGLSLKPSKHMEDMKIDMAGGASVLGLFKVLSVLELTNKNIEIVGILPACENMPSGRALRPGDILQTITGKTIEVTNTDAEGRLTLVDAIGYAEKYIKPDAIIDIATLTGACMVALGKDIAGGLGNNKELCDQFMSATKSTGEEMWMLPLYKPYNDSLKSNIADIKNVSGTGYGGTITASLFISNFVEKNTPWFHIDIAGPAFSDEDKGIYAKGGTGWGVVSFYEFINNFKHIS